MPDYKEMYLKMVRESERAITLTEQVLKTLIAAQCDCEETYINSPDPIIQLLHIGTKPQQDEKAERNEGSAVMCKAMEDMRNQAALEQAKLIASRILATGKSSLEEIASMTELSLDEVKELQKMQSA